jgi:hypothetical protein
MRHLRRFLATLLLTAALALPSAARADGYVPASAKTQIVRVKLDDGRTERVQIAPTAHGYYVFPAFELTAARVRFSDSPDEPAGEAFPLIQPDGRSSFLQHSGYARVEITVSDLLGGNDASAVYDALERSSDPAVKGKDRAEPDLDDQWTATLEVRDPDDGGRFLAVGMPWTFTRDGAGALTMTFLPHRSGDNRVGQLLDRATAADLRLTITGRYTAEFTTTDFRVTGDFMDQQSKELVSKLTSKAGDKQAVLFVPVGGDVDHEGSFADLFQRSMQLVLERRAGGDASNRPDADLVRMFIARSIDQFESKVKLSEQAQDTIVSFLLSNGVRVTTPIGDVKKITDYFKTERDRKMHDLFEHLSKEQTKVDVDTEASVDLLGILGGSGKVAVDYDHMTEDQQRQVRDRFSHDLDEMQKMVDGTLPTVTTMNLADLERISSGGWFRASLESAQFTEGTKELPIRLGLDVPVLRKAQPSEAFVSAIRDRLDAAARGFAGWDQQQAAALPGASYENLSHEYGTRLASFSGLDRDVDRAEAHLAEIVDQVRASLPAGWRMWEEGTDADRKIYARRTDAGAWLQIYLLYSSGSYVVVLEFEAPQEA